MQLQSFEEAFDKVEGLQKPSILLGNGFSQACMPKIFNYSTLLDNANFGDRDEKLRRLFDQFETFDFEKIMSKLVSAEAVGEIYGVGQTLLEEIREDQSVLKNTLLQTISNRHPSRPHEVDIQDYLSVRSGPQFSDMTLSD